MCQEEVPFHTGPKRTLTTLLARRERLEPCCSGGRSTLPRHFIINSFYISKSSPTVDASFFWPSKRQQLPMTLPLTGLLWHGLSPLHLLLGPLRPGFVPSIVLAKRYFSVRILPRNALESWYHLFRNSIESFVLCLQLERKLWHQELLHFNFSVRIVETKTTELYMALVYLFLLLTVNYWSLSITAQN